MVGEILVDGVEPAALGGGAVKLLHEHRRPACPSGIDGAHDVTARG